TAHGPAHRAVASSLLPKPAFISSRHTEPIQHDRKNGSAECNDEPRYPPQLEIEQQDESGQRYNRHQHGRDVNQDRPDRASIAAFVQIIDHRDETVVSLREPVMARLAIDESIGSVAWPLERDDALGVVHSKIGEGAVNRVSLSQMLDDLEL